MLGVGEKEKKEERIRSVFACVQGSVPDWLVRVLLAHALLAHVLLERIRVSLAAIRTPGSCRSPC